VQDCLLQEKDDEEPEGHDELSEGIVHVHLVYLLNLQQHLPGKDFALKSMKSYYEKNNVIGNRRLDREAKRGIRNGMIRIRILNCQLPVQIILPNTTL
jgi:hypothetical protein